MKATGGEVDFNSIKVRLEQMAAAAPSGEAKTFQFHKGAIRTYIRRVPRRHRSPFQFHKGAIRTNMLDSQSGYYKGNFNSIKVRLEH